jgi:DNA-binding MarR family transcriptional regulator
MGRILKERIQQEREFESLSQEALLNLFVASAHARKKIERVCRAYKLQFSHYNVLRILRGAHPGGHARCDIIERMIDPSPDVTRLIDKLVERGLVRRSPSEEDRRRTIHTITDAGIDLLDDMHPDIKDVQGWFGRRVSDDDLRHLSRICEGIYARPSGPPDA